MKNNTTHMWKFETKNFHIAWDITCDIEPDCGEWETSGTIMTCTYKPTGAVLAKAYLGGSSYEDPAAFRDRIGTQGKWSSYYKDTVMTVCREGREAMLKMQGQPMRRTK